MKENSTAQKMEQKNTVPALRILPKEQTNDAKPAEEVKPVQEQGKAEQPSQETKVLTIDDIKRKNEVLRRLTAKYDTLQDKRRKVENFKISHDTDTASVTVSDATGEVFESNSPKTIGKLIEFWTEEFNNALAEVEKEIRVNA